MVGRGPNTVAELNVSITADTTDVEAKVEKTKGFLGSLRSGLRTLLMPAIVLAGADRLWTLLSGATHQTRDFRKELQGVSDALSRQTQQLAANLATLDAAGKNQLRVLQQSLEAHTAIDRGLEGQLRSLESFGGALRNIISIVSTGDSLPSRLAKEAEKAGSSVDRITRQNAALQARTDEAAAAAKAALEQKRIDTSVAAEKKAIDGMIADRLDGEARINFEMGNMRDELTRRRQATENDVEREAIRQRQDELTTLWNFRLQKHREGVNEESRREADALRKREQAEIESAERTSRAVSEVFRAAERQRNQEIVTSINNIAVSVQTAIQKLDLLARLTRE